MLRWLASRVPPPPPLQQSPSKWSPSTPSDSVAAPSSLDPCELFPRARLPRLLPFGPPCVSSQEARLLEHGAERHVEALQGGGDPMTDRLGLPSEPTPLDSRLDTVDPRGLRLEERRDDSVPMAPVASKVCGERLAVDAHEAFALLPATPHPHACSRRLPPTSRVGSPEAVNRHIPAMDNRRGSSTMREPGGAS